MNEQEIGKLTPKLIFLGYGIPLMEFLKIKEKPSRAQTINVRELLEEEFTALLMRTIVANGTPYPGK